MILGIILGCTTYTGVVIVLFLSTIRSAFKTIAECRMEMTDVNKYIGDNFEILTGILRPN